MSNLSHSQVETWESCNRKWFLQKVKRVTQAPAAPLIFGDCVHQALAADGLQYLADGRRLDVHALYDVFQETLEDRLHQDDPTALISLEEVYEMGLNGGYILNAYVYGHPEQGIDPIQPYYFPLAVEQWLGKEPPIPIPDADGWTFTGIVDARIITQDGRGILDWKTGKPWPFGAEHGKVQASAYLWADQMNDAADPAEFVLFLLLPVVNGECFPQRRITRRDSWDLYAYTTHLAIVAHEIDAAKASGDFPAKTGPLCGWCNCLGSCADGQNWLRSKGRESHVPGVTIEGTMKL
jgi:hypothetical protein